MGKGRRYPSIDFESVDCAFGLIPHQGQCSMSDVFRVDDGVEQISLGMVSQKVFDPNSVGFGAAFCLFALLDFTAYNLSIGIDRVYANLIRAQLSGQQLGKVRVNGFLQYRSKKLRAVEKKLDPVFVWRHCMRFIPEILCRLEGLVCHVSGLLEPEECLREQGPRDSTEKPPNRERLGPILRLWPLA